MYPAPTTSRQRMIAALNCQSVDHLPCSFMLFKGLWLNSATYLDFIQQQLNLGLDVFVQIPPRQPGLISESYNLHGLPVHFHPDVTIREWKEADSNEKWPIMVKEYHTPVGILRAEVYQDEEWVHGNHIPFLDDYVESRARKFIITGRDDLKALRYLLVSPTKHDIANFQADSSSIIDFARRHDLLITGGWGVGADLIGWIFGLQNMIFATYDQPSLIHELLSLINDWNRSRMQVVLEAGIDLYVKRAWYENCDFWSPRVWREFIFPILRSDVELAHQHGALFGYLITSNCMQLLNMIAEAGIDVIIGVDPACWDLALAKENLSGKVCLWGGVNGHLTVEQGSVEAVVDEVRKVIQVFGDDEGFILSPVDNVRELNAVSDRNIKVLIQEWKRWTNQSI